MLVVLGLGSNLGDSRRIVLDAMTVLEQEVLTELRRASLYETAPLHVTDQGRFINSAVAGFYPGTRRRHSSESMFPSGKPRELLARIHEIEARFGRDRSRERRWGERFLDIDILLFGDFKTALPATEDDPWLEIPHPLLKERRFALQPLLELLPDAVEPGTGISYRSICDALPDQGVKQIRN